jgi:hypothetical protein
MTNEDGKLKTNEQPITRRFGASGGAVPQKRQCSFVSSPPARASVSRRLRQAAGTMWRNPLRSLRHIGSDSFTARCARRFADFAHLTALRNSGGEQNQQAYLPPPQLRKAVRAVRCNLGQCVVQKY